MRLKGKTALVTGGAQGLGAAVGKRFIAEGASVLLVDLKGARGRAAARKLGRRARFFEADLRDPAACRDAVREAVRAFRRLDILVNAAATSQRATLEKFTPELFDAQFQIIVRAPLLLSQAALPHLKKRKGVIINIGSVNAFSGHADLLCYAAAKGALNTASRNMGNALVRARVRVHCLNVGWMETEGEHAVMRSMGHPKGFLKKQGRKMPVGRLIKPGEVAEVVALLSSDKAAVFSGAVMELEQYPTGGLIDFTKYAF